MQNAGLEEAQAGIKIAGRNINNLRYEDDTIFMAESEEELKSLLTKVKEESGNVGLKLNIQKTKVKGWKKIFHTNRDQKKAGVAILVSDKIDFKTKAVKRDKDSHYIMIKGSIQEEDKTIINIYAPNI